jgi:aspartyl-tRNA(Asn)/glutamyl-tRNA(Gln) amidotransferase subunit B
MFDETKGMTIKMRSKENAEDYRFISEPDLPVLKIEKSRVESIKKELPETPQIKLERLIKKYKLDKSSAEVLTKNLEIVELFEKVIEKINPNFALPWITVELLGVLNYNKKTIDDSEVDIKAEHIIELLQMLKENKITPLKAKDILRKFVPKSFSPKQEAKGSEKIDNPKELEIIISLILKENSKSVEDFKSGKKEAFNFLIGKIMEKTQKRADYQKRRELLMKLLTK